MSASRIRTKPGDVFSVQLDSGKFKCFQYVVDDESQLSSQVIRAFRTAYESLEDLDPAEVVKDEVSFYAHVFLKVGVKLGVWSRVGNVAEVGDVPVHFKTSEDIGRPEIPLCQDSCRVVNCCQSVEGAARTWS